MSFAFFTHIMMMIKFYFISRVAYSGVIRIRVKLTVSTLSKYIICLIVNLIVCSPIDNRNNHFELFRNNRATFLRSKAAATT